MVALACVASYAAGWAAAGVGPAEPVTSTEAAATSGFPQIMVDQIGYSTDGDKMVIFADPVIGQNAARDYTPGATFEVRRVGDNTVVFTGDITPWKNGEVQKLSGDKVWWGDLSALKEPGEYYIFDPSTGERSYAFMIGPKIYDDAMRASLRTFYLQRCGVELLEKYSGDKRWTHPPCHVGPDQDTAARRYPATEGGATVDVSGGWHDAGDYTKYTPFVIEPLWKLLTAYRWNPSVFGDNNGIPESGNAVPDLLDEVKWELDYLLKVQEPDGGVVNRVGTEKHPTSGSPETDTQPRRRTLATSWATSTFAGVMALAAPEFAKYEKQYPGYSKKLATAAERAWAWLEKHPEMTPPDGKDGASSNMVSAHGDSDAKADARLRIFAAANLFALTGDAKYRDYFDRRFSDQTISQTDSHPLKGWDATNNTELNYAFVSYALSKGATPSVVAEIKRSLRESADMIEGYFARGEDGYRAFTWDGHYCWGSNSVKSNWAGILIYAARLNVAPDRTAAYRRAAAGYLHYIHGRNALNLCYLSNANSLGADRSVMKPYHTWFNAGVVPAPGYLVGGPNMFYDKKFNNPPFGQPPMKSYLDFQRGWNAEHQTTEDSWAISEPAIYYQANYTFLLSEFAGR